MNRLCQTLLLVSVAALTPGLSACTDAKDPEGEGDADSDADTDSDLDASYAWYTPDNYLSGQPCQSGGTGAQYWSTTDLTGDGLSDLVVTYNSCGDDATGHTRWEVYPGTCGS